MTAPPNRSIAEAMEKLADDGRSHGAFHLWHTLWHAKDSKTYKVNLGYRRIAQKLKCSQDSIKGWIDELVETGWLSVTPAPRLWRPGQPFKTGTRNVYTLLDGTGEPLKKLGADSKDKTAPKSRSSFRGSKKYERSAHKDKGGPPLEVGAYPSPTPVRGDRTGEEVTIVTSSPATIAPALLPDGKGSAVAEGNHPGLTFPERYHERD